jgi:hypothetical protein
MTIQEFRIAYIGVLKKDIPEYGFSEDQAIKTADKMIDAIKRADYRADWLKHNQAMRLAAKQFGITSSKEFRETIKTEAVND